MSIALVKKIRDVTGLTFAEKSILFQLADISHDGQEVFIKMENLARYAGCSIRTARRVVRRLEEIGVIIPQGETGGRGYVNVWRFKLDPLSPAASAEDPPPPAEVPGINGKAPPVAEGELPPQQPRKPLRSPNVHVYDDPSLMRPDEKPSEYAARLNRMGRR